MPIRAELRPLYPPHWPWATCSSAFTNFVCVMLGDYDRGRDDRQAVGRGYTPEPIRAACSKPWTRWIWLRGTLSNDGHSPAL